MHSNNKSSIILYVCVTLEKTKWMGNAWRIFSTLPLMENIFCHEFKNLFCSFRAILRVKRPQAVPAGFRWVIYKSKNGKEKHLSSISYNPFTFK